MAIFILSICLSAFLIFLVEPMIGKILLPWFGGSAAVWSTAMVFFQVLLTGGYAYAAWISGKTSRRGWLHLFLLGLSLILLLALGSFWKSPITPSSVFRPSGTLPPELEIFLLLAVTVGLPFFLLSANSTLVQVWFARQFPERSPYRLYALSNFSSLAALLVYPFLVEPNLPLTGQSWSWSLSYLLFATLAGFITLTVMRSHPAKVPASLGRSVERLVASPIRIKTKEILLWIGLSACASILFLSTTGYITQEVAVVPFLWVLPLAIYLLSFVLTFSGERWYSRQLFIFLLLPVILAYDLAMSNAAALGILWQVVIFCLVLFLGCMVCNGELYRHRPTGAGAEGSGSSARLPFFYLLLSAGGALGGILVAFAAPALFKGFWEYPLGLLLFSILFLVVGRGPKKTGFKTELLSNINLTFLAVAVLITGLRAFRFIGSDLGDALQSQRNFYGVVHIRATGTASLADFSYQMINGNTIHGAQFPNGLNRDSPTVYYGPSSGVGLALLNHPRPAGGLRVGALGLGVGTIASYGQPGDDYTFYEINPLVIQLAQGAGGYFSYLRDSKATLHILPGDARLSMQTELASAQVQLYDVLVLDVFSNDAIPVHLLDQQAFELYLQFLAPGGVLAVHISNYYLDLTPVVWKLADHFNLERVLISDPGDGVLTSPSSWILLARAPALLAIPAISNRAQPMTGYTSSLRLWTDQYSNLFQVLKH